MALVMSICRFLEWRKLILGFLTGNARAIHFRRLKGRPLGISAKSCSKNAQVFSDRAAISGETVASTCFASLDHLRFLGESAIFDRVQ